MKALYKVLLVVAVVGAGALFYAKKKDVDLKTLFSSKCDCHASGCDLKSSSLSTTAHPEPVHASTPTPEHPTHAAPVKPVVPAHPTHAAPVKPVVPAQPAHATPVKPVVPAQPAHAAPVKA